MYERRDGRKIIIFVAKHAFLELNNEKLFLKWFSTLIISLILKIAFPFYILNTYYGFIYKLNLAYFNYLFKNNLNFLLIYNYYHLILINKF